MAFIKDNPPPATVILISGDRDFAHLLSTVRWRKYNVVLISNSPMTHESLTVQASVVYDWESDVLKTRPPPRPPLPGSQALSSVVSTTTPQVSDNLPESDAHPVGLPKGHVAPAVQPLTLSHSPVDTITIHTTRPRHATLPSTPPSVESEATSVPPKRGTPVKTPSANVPMNPTPDDRIVVDLAGGPTMVHPSTVCGTGIDLVFQQDPASPKLIDSVGEDSFHSPAFVSIREPVVERKSSQPVSFHNTTPFPGSGDTDSHHIQTTVNGSRPRAPGVTFEPQSPPSSNETPDPDTKPKRKHTASQNFQRLSRRIAIGNRRARSALAIQIQNIPGLEREGTSTLISKDEPAPGASTPSSS